MAEASKTRIGFVGLGIMGAAMARNLSKAGFPVTVYNRTREKADALAQETGASVADTPKQAAQNADIVITMVSDVPDVYQVYLEENGINEVARPGMVCVDMGTVGAECAHRVAEELSRKGAGFVDAPVSGGSWGAQQGTLSIMAGGSKADFASALPAFEAMGKKIVHCGPVGSGQTVKLINQIVVAVNLESVCEGLAFAGKSGVDTAKVLDAVGAGAAGSWAWTNLGPRIVGGDNAPGFKIAHQIKDLRLALEAAESMGQKLPGVRLALEHLQTVQNAKEGNGDLGTQALIEALR